MNILRYLSALALLVVNFGLLHAQPAQPAPKLKDEFRRPWSRSEERFLRLWLVAGPLAGTLDSNSIPAAGGEAALQPTEGQTQTGMDGKTAQWHSVKSWADLVGVDDQTGSQPGSVVYAYAKVVRQHDGKAMLSVGSLDGIRVWANGALVLSRNGLRSPTPDEDQVEVTMKKGENALLIKVAAGGRFYARILEPGSVYARREEIAPSLVNLSAQGFTLKTDIDGTRADADAVNVQVIRPGGSVVFSTSAARGANVEVNARDWSDGPYEVRCTTLTPRGLLYAAHLPWYKGDFLPKAKELAATAAAADVTNPEGFTLKMLAEMVEDRLGCKLSDVKGNPWLKVHSPLMEYDEMMLERKGQTGRIRPYGFVRFAYTDEVDGTPQFCRAYLPGGYDPAKKWPLVIELHGYNPANPVYVRWWAADQRHAGLDGEFSDHQGVIYVEPHGRGNTQYLGMGDNDIMHIIAEAKRLFNVDEDRIYLTGDSMGGWGTWNVGTRHPDMFAAIAPVFGGTDYHATMSEEDLAALTPLNRFFSEKSSSWGMADGLLNVPIFVHHGDADQSVNVDFSRYGVRLLQRWGYDVRYHEYPGRGHEALENSLGNGGLNIEWFLQHRRNSNPRHVRIRSAELRHASAYWVHVRQAASPLAFMSVDAEILGRNVIRLDSDNILDLELSPSPVLIDPAKPVDVVWNGVSHVMNIAGGSLVLTDPVYHPAEVHKSRVLPGVISDLTTTPFAVVVGTISKDTAMVSLCRRKANAFVAQWTEWQKYPPRLFDDVAMSSADIERYSLVLIGGSDANKVTAKLASQLPLKITSRSVSIDGKTFQVRDAAVQMLYPHPLNPERYVLVTAGTSTEGMYFNELMPQNLSPWDYFITDARMPAYHQKVAPGELTIVSGMFDYNWHYDASLTQQGDSAQRAKAIVRHRPNPNFVVQDSLLQSYTGRYVIAQGPTVDIVKSGKHLLAKVQGAPGDGEEMVPESSTNFTIIQYNVWISFVRDSTGNVAGLMGYQGRSFEGKKVK